MRKHKRGFECVYYAFVLTKWWFIGIKQNTVSRSIRCAAAEIIIWAVRTGSQWTHEEFVKIHLDAGRAGIAFSTEQINFIFPALSDRFARCHRYFQPIQNQFYPANAQKTRFNYFNARTKLRVLRIINTAIIKLNAK